ncbi:hypothetical protein IscW_ISCW013781, partial [Ixodes scapularis]
KAKLLLKKKRFMEQMLEKTDGQLTNLERMLTAEDDEAVLAELEALEAEEEAKAVLGLPSVPVEDMGEPAKVGLPDIADRESHFQKQDHDYERVLRNTPKKQTKQKLLSSEHDTHEDTPLYTATAAQCDRRLAKTVGTNLRFQTTQWRGKLQTSREDCPCTEATPVGVFVHVHVTTSLSESVVLVAQDLLEHGKVFVPYLMGLGETPF